MNDKNKSTDPEEQAQIEDPVEDQDPPRDEVESQEEPQADETTEQTIQRLQAEADEYLDGWQRARAEFANYKKRIERERESARERISGEIITRYLGVMDDLERAIEKAPASESCKEWVAGVDLIYSKFRSILEAEGVETIEEAGLRFDPNIHEAISYEDSDEYEEGSVIEVTQRGYKLDDRVLRPAMVRVAK